MNERFTVRTDRATEIVGLDLDRFGELEIQRGLLLGHRLELGLAEQRLAQLVPVAASALELGDCGERAAVAWIETQRLLHRMQRVVGTRQLAITASDRHPQRHRRIAIFSSRSVARLP